ncbi:hypothetical protein [Bradyrhizobium diazoefficiens]|uniref:hypothetical protein n=1 Tax=Bradyrhizobium diazoefficiens TaxID=1355477 RepID=UPI00272D5A27|nr:hypothetical protein [Bradyrhizobium diazoefficiens]WLA68550.1 hypothetical protein QNN01_18945 [Bradyrhizobium diazoefficiens]
MAILSAAVRAALATVGIDTPPKAFAALVPFAISILVTIFPVGSWSIVIAGAAWIMTFLVLIIWHRRDISRQPVKVGLSPLYTEKGREQVRSEQRALDNEIARLRAVSARLAADMAKLDATASDWQQKHRQLADQKKTVDQNLAALEKLPRTKIGFVPRN